MGKPADLLGAVAMTTKRRRSLASDVSNAETVERAQLSVEDFLKALNSYPDRFAHDPQLSFEQHLSRELASDGVCHPEGERHAS